MADVMQFVQNPPLTPYQFACSMIALILAIVAGTDLVKRKWRWGIIFLCLAIFAFMAGFAPRAHGQTLERKVAQIVPASWVEKRAIENWCRNRKRDLNVCIPDCTRKKDCH